MSADTRRQSGRPVRVSVQVRLFSPGLHVPPKSCHWFALVYAIGLVIIPIIYLISR
jgi:hypothetical protein